MTERSSPEQRFEDIRENAKRIEENLCAAALESGRRREDIRFMAVTKTVEPVYINYALSLGIDLIGENKVQELLSKIDLLDRDSAEIHVIGHLQSNKVRKIIGVADMIQSVDSISLADEISRQSLKNGVETDILLEVNIGLQESKTGLSPEQIPEAAAQISEIPGLNLRGLMTIPPICESGSEARGYFEKTRRLFEDMKSSLHKDDIDVLSMGMSADYAEAVLEGATLVRIGSALFGPRIYK